MAKHKFRKGERVCFSFKDSEGTYKNGYGTVLRREGRFYLIDAGAGLPLRIYCNRVQKNWAGGEIVADFKPLEATPFDFKKPTEKDDLISLPLKAENKNYRLIRKISYDGELCYAVQLRKHFWIFSWWQYLTTDEGLISKLVLFEDFNEAFEIAEEMCKGRVIKQYDR